MSKLIYKTMAHLADEEAGPSNQQMPQDLFLVKKELHDTGLGKLMFYFLMEIILK